MSPDHRSNEKVFNEMYTRITYLQIMEMYNYVYNEYGCEG